MAQDYFDYANCVQTINYLNTMAYCQTSHVNHQNCGTGHRNSTWNSYHGNYSNYGNTPHLNTNNHCHTYTDYTNHVNYTNSDTGAPQTLAWTSPWSGNSLAVTYISQSVDAILELRNNIRQLSETKSQQTASVDVATGSVNVGDAEFDGVGTDHVEDNQYDALRDSLYSLWSDIKGDGITAVREIIQIVCGPVHYGGTANPIYNLAGKYFLIFNGTSQFYVWYKVGTNGVDPLPGGTSILVDLTTADTAETVAAKTAIAINANANFSATSMSNFVTVTCSFMGPSINSSDFNTGFHMVDVTKGHDAVVSSNPGLVVRDPGHYIKKSEWEQVKVKADQLASYADPTYQNVASYGDSTHSDHTNYA